MLYIVKVWDAGELYEYEYGCIRHALEHIELEKGCAKLYRYSAGAETAVEGVAKPNVCADSGRKPGFAAEPLRICKRKR